MKSVGTTTSEDAPVLSGKRKAILEFIESQLQDRGYPPSVREIGEAVGLTSSSTVHAHLATLQKQGFLRRDPTKPRAIEVHYDATSGGTVNRRPVRHVPLVGEVAAGVGLLAQQNIEESMPLPEDLTGGGELFMLKVRGESMIEVGIFDGDYVVVRKQPSAEKGQIVVAGVPGDEVTVKTYMPKGNRIILQPANASMEPIDLSPEEVTIFGKVVTVLRSL